MICVSCENDRHGSDVSWLRGRPICAWCSDELEDFMKVFGFKIEWDQEEEAKSNFGTIRLEEQC